NGNTTVDFIFNSSPVTTEGLQSMSIPGGVIFNQDDSQSNQPFNGNFRYDPNPMFVTSTDPAADAVVNLSGTTENLIMNFSEPFDPNSVSTSRLQVSLGTVTAATPELDGSGHYTIVDFTISNISGEGFENYTLPYGGITDADGNPVLAYSSDFI